MEIIRNLAGIQIDRAVKCFGVKLQAKSGYSLRFNFCSHPTMNCQVFSISAIKDVILHFTLEQFISELFLVCKEIEYQPKLLLVDVEDLYKEKLISFFKKENILFLTDYTSTNGSYMSIGLVNIKNLDHYEHGNSSG